MSNDSPISMEDKLKNFLSGIDDYIANNNLQGVKFNDEFRVGEELTFEEIGELDQNECFTYGYMLLQYASHVNSKKSDLQTIVNWCDVTIADIVGREYENVDQYAKHEIKVGIISQDNPILKKVIDWRLTAQGRMESLENKEYLLKRKADCLIEKGKRK